MLAMSLLLLDFAAIPVLAIALAVLLVLYYRRWSAWRASQRGAQGAGAPAKEA